MSTNTALYAAIGEGHVTSHTVAERLGRELRGEDERPAEVETSRLPSTVTRRTGGRRRPTQAAGVHVEGLDDIMIRLSRCCSPVPPDEILGFVTRGRGVSVHRSDCLNATELSAGQPDRLIEVEWTVSTLAASRPRSRSGRLIAVRCSSMSPACCSTTASSSPGSRPRRGMTPWPRCSSSLNLPMLASLDSVLSSLFGVESVYDAYRILPGAARN